MQVEALEQRQLTNSQQYVELAVVVPTFNERDNVRPLLDCLDAALQGIRWEVIFVDDDSTDETADLLRIIAQRDPRVRLLLRLGRRGLSSACVEGILCSSAPYIAVMDADMQHDESLLPAMLTCLKEGDLELVVGSRYATGGSVAGWDQRRQIISRFASKVARLLTKADLHDPMSGFFLMRREAFDRVVRNLSQRGFKILLDLCASASPPLRVKELPYRFRPRERGESKLDSMAVWEYAMLLTDKLFGGVLPSRFVLFAVVGASGIFVHLAALALALYAGMAFTVAQTVAVILATTSNFTLNNIFTYRDRRLEGWGFVKGLLSFYVICSAGALANVGIASLMYRHRAVWWLAGLSGAAIGVVWNYAVSSYVTWRSR